MVTKDIGQQMRIDCFIPYLSDETTGKVVATLREQPETNNIYLLVKEETANATFESCKTLKIDNIESSNTLRTIADATHSEYMLLYTKSTELHLGQKALHRLLSVGNDCSAGIVYADHYLQKEGKTEASPLIDYQLGSVRDDFNFGSLLVINTAAVREALDNRTEFRFAGLYDLRLQISRKHPIVHINEFLYTDIENDNRTSGEKQFDYVDPRNREVQLEKENICTEHLKKIDAYLAPKFKNISFNEHDFKYEASVIIPVKNRNKTIGDAISSVLKQETDFRFNLIIIDNHSTDGTSETIDEWARKDDKIIHLIPKRSDLGIGGCWNEGIHHPLCGKFAIQLDSDDVYKDANTITSVVKAFYEQRCAMVIGSYMITDFQMRMIPPGLIDHKEWTPENGRNNALRINGLGAPRAFYTPLLREIGLPNTSYGEDYAIGLAISRHYQIGRIYDVLYMCRRWEGNSDAALDIPKVNKNNLYKDKIRTIEIMARQKMNAKN